MSTCPKAPLVLSPYPGRAGVQAQVGRCIAYDKTEVNPGQRVSTGVTCVGDCNMAQGHYIPQAVTCRPNQYVAPRAVVARQALVPSRQRTGQNKGVGPPCGTVARQRYPGESEVSSMRKLYCSMCLEGYYVTSKGT